MATHTDDQKEKLVTLEGLGKYHHSMVSALGLTQDTGAYNYTYTSTDPAHTGETHTAPTTVKGAMDELYGKTMLMCDAAKAFYEKEYHKQFKANWDTGSGSMSPTSKTYAVSDVGDKTVNLIATFTPGSYSVEYVDANGDSKTTTVPTKFVNNGTAEQPSYLTVSSGWTITSQSETSVTATKTLTVPLGTLTQTTAYSGTTDSCTATGNVYIVDPVTRELTTKVEPTQFSKEPGFSASQSKPSSFYITNVEVTDGAEIKTGSTTGVAKARKLFEDNVLTATSTGTTVKTFTDGKDVSYTGTGKYIIFFTQKSDRVIKSAGLTDMIEHSTNKYTGSLGTRWGTYYYYISASTSAEGKSLNATTGAN